MPYLAALATLPLNLIVINAYNNKRMRNPKIAVGVVAVALFVGCMTAPAANYHVGFKAYQRGDYATALRIFRQLADQGNANAQGNLGLMYEKGKGVPQDYVQAHMWYNLAAAQSDVLGREILNVLAQRMTPSQIAEAQKRATEWELKRSRSKSKGLFAWWG